MTCGTRNAGLTHEAVVQAARFACDDVIRLPKQKARTTKGPQWVEWLPKGCDDAMVGCSPMWADTLGGEYDKGGW